jgi:hypothetical protein
VGSTVNPVTEENEMHPIFNQAIAEQRVAEAVRQAEARRRAHEVEGATGSAVHRGYPRYLGRIRRRQLGSSTA